MGITRDISEVITAHVIPVITTAGLVLNLLILAVVSRKRMRGTTLALYMTCLAGVDILVLALCASADRMVRYPGGWIHTSPAACRAGIILLAVIPAMEAAVLIFITVDRFCAVKKPLKYKKLFAYKRVSIGLTAILLVCVTLHLTALFSSQIEDGLCRPAEEANFASALFLLGTFVFSNLLSSLLMLLLSVLTLCALARQRIQIDFAAAQKQKRKKVTTMSLIFVPLAFLLMRFPMLTFALYDFYAGKEGKGLKDPDSIHWMLRCIGEMLLALNSSVNIFLYSLKGSMFRSEICDLYRDARSYFRNRKKVGPGSQPNNENLSGTGTLPTSNRSRRQETMMTTNQNCPLQEDVETHM